jgi:DNA-binding winged helix-turn-helix (wHTH) protein/tetratricopeptide (TPR) repeat protein
VEADAPREAGFAMNSLDRTDRVIYQFDGFRLDPRERQLLRDGSPVPLTDKAFQTLLLLVRRSGHLVDKSELISAVWGETIVEEGNLAVTISIIRKKLGEKRNEHKYIETVTKLGYRFVHEIRELDVSELESPKPPESHPSQASSFFPRRRLLSVVSGIAVGLIVAGVIGLELARPSKAAHENIHALAVIPFQTTGAESADSADAHLGLNIADDLITRLGTDGSVELRPASALMKYVGIPVNPLIVGREQNVDAILTGSIANSEEGIHLSVQLIEASDGKVLWTGTFEKPGGQVLALEDQLEGEVFRFMFPDRKPLLRAGQETRNPHAYQLYLEGRYFWNKRTEAGLRRSIECFQHAALEDPGYAKALAGLADSYTLLASYGVEGEQEAYPNAKAAALRALQLDPSLAEAHASLGMVAFYYEWNWPTAEAEFQRAIQLDPNYPMAHTWYALVLAATGQQQKALEQAQRGIELDPLSLVANTELGRVYYWGRHYDKAIAAYKHAIDLDPYFSRAHTRLGIAYAAEHDFRDAIGEFQKVNQLSGPDPYLDGLIGYSEAASGNRVAAQRILNNLTDHGRGDYVPAFSVALVYMGLDERDNALTSLAKSYQDRSTYMVYSNVDPLLDSLRSQPQFVSLMDRMAFSQQQVADRSPIPTTVVDRSPHPFAN